MIMLKFYNLSRQSQTHSREITNTFVTQGCESGAPPPSSCITGAPPDPLQWGGQELRVADRLPPPPGFISPVVMKYT